MYDKLKKYCKTKVPLTDEELKLIDSYFEVKDLKKKDFFTTRWKNLQLHWLYC
jgi:hypothetical protein